jgi:hypothetical protein
LHASVVAQLGRHIRDFSHLEKALEVVNTIRDLGPIPRHETSQKRDHPQKIFTRGDWSVKDYEKFQNTISGYIYSLSLLVTARYATKYDEKEHKALKPLQDAVFTLEDTGRFRVRFERDDHYPLLGEALKMEWENLSGCNMTISDWMKRTMQGVRLIASQLPDGTHRAERVKVPDQEENPSVNPVINSA